MQPRRKVGQPAADVGLLLLHHVHVLLDLANGVSHVIEAQGQLVRAVHACRRRVAHNLRGAAKGVHVHDLGLEWWPLGACMAVQLLLHHQDAAPFCLSSLKPPMPAPGP